MSEPVHIAAIDAGSNAVRLSVARAYSALDIEPLYNERYSLRLGESVFLRHRFSEDIFKKGMKAFRHFKEVMEEHGVTKYRAVATSASREARNRKKFLREIKRKCGIAPGPRSGHCRAGAGFPAALHHRSRRRKPGDQHSSRPYRGAKCTLARRHGAVDDHAEYPWRDPSRTGRAGTALRARSARIEITFTPEPWRKLRGRTGWKRGNARLDCTRPARTRCPHAPAFSIAGAFARHPGARRARTHEDLRRAPRSRRRDGHRRDHLHHAGPVLELAHPLRPQYR